MRMFCEISEAVAQMRKGKLLIVVDGPERENEGDFYIPSEKVAPRHLLTMMRFGGGLICTAITREQARHLAMPFMVSPRLNKEKTRVNFTISVSARKGVTTGVSAFDRAKTIKVLSNLRSKKSDLTRPGHVIGLVGNDGGVVERAGHTEAAIDLARLAGFSPSGVLCEIVGKSGRMARRAELCALSSKLGAKVVLIQDLVQYIRKNAIRF